MKKIGHDKTLCSSEIALVCAGMMPPPLCEYCTRPNGRCACFFEDHRIVSTIGKKIGYTLMLTGAGVISLTIGLSIGCFWLCKKRGTEAVPLLGVQH